MDVYKRLKGIHKGMAALALAATAALSAQTPAPAAHAASAPALPPTPPTTTKFFPLSEIHRGLQGVAYTVFEGTKPEPMGIEILGLLHNALGPRQDMILARLEGTKPEYTGVVAGMSGSPVYIDGRLVGALSYRIGMFSKEPICGITPIAAMLGVEEQHKEPATELADARRLRPRAYRVKRAGCRRRQQPRHGGQPKRKPGRSPYSANGYAAGLQRI
jgi:hypothetical protein